MTITWATEKHVAAQTAAKPATKHSSTLSETYVVLLQLQRTANLLWQTKKYIHQVEVVSELLAGDAARLQQKDRVYGPDRMYLIML